MSDQYIWRFLREQKIDLAARKSRCQADDPDFVAKAAEIVGLYLDPPQDGIVLAVDEKPHIQALERAQGYLKLPNGRALSGRSHDYKCSGTSTGPSPSEGPRSLISRVRQQPAGAGGMSSESSPAASPVLPQSINRFGRKHISS